MMNQKGFTLIEIMAVMVMIGVLASVAVKKQLQTQDNARLLAIDVAVAELRSRETLTWTREMFGGSYKNDVDMFTSLDTNVGSKYTWTVVANPSGGTIRFETVSRALTRTPSSREGPGSWNLM